MSAITRTRIAAVQRERRRCDELLPEGVDNEVAQGHHQSIRPEAADDTQALEWREAAGSVRSIQQTEGEGSTSEDDALMVHPLVEWFWEVLLLRRV